MKPKSVTNPRSARLAMAALIAVAVLAAHPRTLSAQGRFRRGGVPIMRQGNVSEADREQAENVFLLPERSLLQQLGEAKELLQAGSYGDAVRYLGGILEGPEDYFFQPDKNAPNHRSLKGEAQRLIGQMPREGRELYELQFGARARRMLADAKSAGNAELLAEVSRRFFHTAAGYEATFLLGLYQFDHARPFAAALTLQRLRDAVQDTEADRFEPTLSLTMATSWLQAGMPDKAEEALVALKEHDGSQPLTILGRQVPLFVNNADAIAWLTRLVGPQRAADHSEPDRWLMFRGDAARNAMTIGGAPLLNMRWEIPVSDEPAVDEMLRQLRQVYVEQDVPVFPALHPLAIDDVVLMRTWRNLLAVDSQTGKRLWEVPVDDALESLSGKTSADAIFRQAPQAAFGLGQRMWEDSTYGTMSSDGRCVFSIEDLGLGPGNPANVNPRFVGPRAQNSPLAPGTYNRLAAHDIRSGKLKWHVGGPPDQFALRQAGTFFLGPPLPLMGRLYVLAESKSQGAILLVAMDAGSGDVLWSQPLAAVDRDITEDPLRRLSGISPSYADGVLVCPTSAGAVVGVDLATRSLLWGYRYFRNDVPSANQAMMMRFGWGDPRAWTQRRWEDGSAAIAGGSVLITPVESDTLHCLNLADGKLRWKYARQDDLYVACIYQGQVVLAGRRGVHALRLADGAPAWDGRTVTLPEGSTPSGRGFCGGHRYYLPLSNAEVVAIDLDAGKIVRTSKSRKGNVPGNLICYQGKVVSQGFEGLETYYQLDAVREEVDRRLGIQRNDPGALALRGEIELDEGKPSAAIDCFRRAYQLDPDVRTKTLLRDALFDGLRLHFAEYRKDVDEIDRLSDDPEQHATLLRLTAAGLEQSGELAPAFEQYLRLIDLDQGHRQVDDVTPALSVRRDRWIRAHVAALRSEMCEPAALAAMDSTIAARLQEALASDELASVQRFLEYFGNQPLAAGARQELIRRLIAADSLLEAEMALWPDQQSTALTTAAPAWATLAEMLRKAGRDEDAAVCYRRLARGFASVSCLEGKTGKQLVDALPQESRVRRLLDEEPAWPSGAVEVKTLPLKSPRQPSYGRVDLRYDGNQAPFFSDTTIHVDQNRRTILACDGWGNERWQMSLTDAAAQNNIYPFVRMAAQAVAVHGHLLLMTVDSKLMAVDTLAASHSDGAERTPRVLWEHDFASSGADGAGRQFPLQLPVGMAVLPWGLQQVGFPTGRSNMRVGAMGPSTSSYVCFQRFRNLIAVDPLSGETLWSYHALPPGCELFGDDELVFAAPPDQTNALVFRALDGQLLGTRPIPRFPPPEPSPDARRGLKYLPLSQTCLATFGRQLLLWRSEDGARLLEMIDPWEERDTWIPRRFSSAAVADLLGDEAVGVCEPDGHFVLFALPDGRTLIDTKLKTDSNFATLTDIHLLKYRDEYLLLTHNPSQKGPGTQPSIQPLPGAMAQSQPIRLGWLYAFDRQGKPLWPHPVSIRDQYFRVDQPSRVPVLTFACQTYVRQGNTARNEISVLSIDKRTGRKVYSARFPSATGIFDIMGDPQRKTVELRLQPNTIVMTFTDKPVPPPSAAAADARAKAAKNPDAFDTIRTLWQAVEKALGLDPGDDWESVDPQEAVTPVESPAAR